MFKILGGDGKEYGPVSVQTLRQWISEGRANADTQVQAEGGTEWLALGTLPEFNDLTGAPAPAGMLSNVVAAEQPSEDKARALAVPAGWALMIIGILGVFMSCAFIGYYAVKGVPANPFVDELFSRQGGSDAARMGQKIGAFAALVVSIGWGAFVAYAGTKLRRLESWGVVLTGAILAIIPCCGSQFPLCVLSAPVGVWVLIVICQSNVKRAFT